MHAFVQRLRELYEGDRPVGVRFRYGLLAFDAATVLFIIATSFFPPEAWVTAADRVIGVIVLLDFLARLLASRNRLKEFSYVSTWADLAAVVSFLAAFTGAGAGFLRVLRSLRLMRTYHVLARLRSDVPFFARNEELVFAIINLIVFIFVMTALVYTTQAWRNEDINNYMDALYFTVTSLTTTGFGDITLEGSFGRLISVVIMIVGVTFFLRLAQVLFRPNKVRFLCPACGLQRHDPDAVHCKACGTLLNIPDEGSW